LRNATLQHEIFDEASNRIIGERSDDGGLETKTASQSSRDVVLSAAFPNAKMAGGGNALVAGIEPQHYLSEADQIPLALRLCLDVQF
jgi:hypothetical protein